jgi:hypothetical protein
LLTSRGAFIWLKAPPQYSSADLLNLKNLVNLNYVFYAPVC